MSDMSPKHQIVDLPFKTQQTLFLIREELKTRKLFSALRKVGLDDCCFQPHLDSLILANLGIDDISDDQYSKYTAILDKRSKKVNGSTKSITTHAIKAYWELKNEIRKMKRI